MTLLWSTTLYLLKNHNNYLEFESISHALSDVDAIFPNLDSNDNYCVGDDQSIMTNYPCIILNDKFMNGINTDCCIRFLHFIKMVQFYIWISYSFCICFWTYDIHDRLCLFTWAQREWPLKKMQLACRMENVECAFLWNCCLHLSSNNSQALKI